MNVKPDIADAHQERALTHPEIRAIVLGIMLAMFLGALDQTIVATALPTIGRHFGDLGDLSWVVTAYLLTGTAVTPLYGKLSDIHGRPRDDADGHRPLHGRLACLRAGAEHAGAGLCARAAGRGRRRADGAGADHHRRHRLAARARPLPGLYRRGVCDLLGRRAGARRLSHPASRLVADLLDQHSARLCRAGHDRQRAQARAVSRAQAQLDVLGAAADDERGGGAAAGAVLGRAQVRLDLAGERRAAVRLRGAVGPVRLAADGDGRAVPAARGARQSRWCAARRSPAPATWACWSA